MSARCGPDGDSLLACYIITLYGAGLMSPRFNLLDLGLPARLGLALVACAVIWAAVLWALV